MQMWCMYNPDVVDVVTTVIEIRNSTGGIGNCLIKELLLSAKFGSSLRMTSHVSEFISSCANSSILLLLLTKTLDCIFRENTFQGRSLTETQVVEANFGKSFFDISSVILVRPHRCTLHYLKVFH